MSDEDFQPTKHDSLSPVAFPTTSSLLDRVPETGLKRSVIASLGAIGFHAAVLAFALTLGARATRHISSTQISQMIEVELPKAVPQPPPLPEPEATEPIKPTPTLKPVPPPPSAEPEPEPPAATPEQEPPPAPAEAAKVLTADAPVLDFGNTFVTGNASQFAGGVTTSDGTSKVAVRNPNARSGGVVGGRGNGGPVVAAPAIDRSRSPQLAGGAQWDCPFPAEADMEQIDQAAVSLEVSVDPSGKVKNVTVKADPGYGFGREARRCALRKNWQPGLDRLGQATGAVARVKVRFQR